MNTDPTLDADIAAHDRAILVDALRACRSGPEAFDR